MTRRKEHCNAGQNATAEAAIEAEARVAAAGLQTRVEVAEQLHECTEILQTQRLAVEVDARQLEAP
eukprot:SAG31_NODE_4875_length_2891_cov_2.693052_1_plen_66_part_00